MRSGKPYDFVRLLSVPALSRLVKRETHFEGRFIVPHVPDEDIELFPPRRAKLARVYNKIAGRKMLRWPLFAVGPFFRFVGMKQADAKERAARTPADVSRPIRREVDVRGPAIVPPTSPRRNPAQPPTRRD